MSPTPPNSLIVVTGITGYIASHVGLAALQTGHRVRGTVRSLGRAEELQAAFEKLGVDVTRLDFVVVDDLTSQPQMEKAFQGADGVAHVALPGSVPGDLDERPKEMIDSNIAVLRAAAKEPSVKRVVFTSSSAAAVAPQVFRDQPFTDEDWNDVIVQRYEVSTEEDKKSPIWVLLRYAAGKTLAERMAWAWVQEEQPVFDVVTLLPTVNFGPVLHGNARSSAAWIHAILHNDGTCTTTFPPQWFIDVRDNARLHILALTTPSFGGKRVWATAKPYGWNQILAILRKEFPHVQVPPDIEGEQGEPDLQRIDNSFATEALGGWISLEKSVLDTAKGFGF